MMIVSKEMGAAVVVSERGRGLAMTRNVAAHVV
jgi:hypothetical protein